MPRNKALDYAYDLGLDLVCVAPSAKPPVCKVMDYKKYLFELSKKKRLAKKNQVVVQIKEIRLRPTIDVGDYNTKVKNARKFLEKGNKVKVSVSFRGRMITHKELGVKLLQKFVEDTKEVSTPQARAKMEGKNLFLLLEPIKK